MIAEYERRTKELEVEEAELIKELEELQMEEKKAFVQLELTMVTASLPKKERLKLESIDDVKKKQAAAKKQKDLEDKLESHKSSLSTVKVDLTGRK